MSTPTEKALLLDELRRFACRDLYKALATYTYVVSSSDYQYTNITYTLKFLGLSASKAEETYEELIKLLSKLEEKFNLKIRMDEEIENVIRSCLEKLNIIDEARKRIEALSKDDKRILQIASLGVKRKIERYTFSTKSFDSVDIAKFTSAMLSRDVGYEHIEELFVRTLLAVRDHSASRKYYYYTMRLIPNTEEILKELAQAAEKEWPSYDYIYSKLRYDAEPYQVATLLNPDESFYEAIYGYKVEDVLSSSIIEKIVYKSAINRFIEDELRKVVQALSQEYCHNIVVDYIVNALRDLGYEVDLKSRGFLESCYCCRYAAIKPRTVLYIYVCPFAIRPPNIGKDEKAVIVVEGVGAKLSEYLEELRSDSWRAHLANALWLGIHKNKVYILSTAGVNWQQEIVKALKKVTGAHIITAVESIKKRPPEAHPITMVPIISAEERPILIPSGVIQSREVLESIVAQALRALGFTVQTNVSKLARKGASIEVDVWAEKRVGDIRFKVYVSCKNWDKDVDRRVVDEEFGRVFNLQEVPHLRILVVKSMSRPAKEVAEADGFFVIELGEKATEANASEVYELIYRKLSDLFTNIAPPQLLEIASKVSKTAEELSKIAHELAKLSKGYG